MKYLNPLRVSLVLVLSLLCVVQSTPSEATNFYMSPSGSNGNPGTFANPWRTFGFAVGQLNPGDTLFLENGTYTQSNTGSLYINCNSGARNGTSSAPITVSAINERQALLQGDGSSSTVFQITGCGWWVLNGLHIAGVDNGGNITGDLAAIASSSHDIIFRRGIVEKPNRCGNNIALIVADSSFNVLLEENEVLNFHRNGIETYPTDVSHVTIRRNYINSLGYGSGGSCAGQNGTGISMYWGHDSIIENNVVEGMPIQVMTNHGDNNRWLGNMAIGGADGLTTGRHPQYGPNTGGSSYTNNVSIGSTYGNYAISDSGVTYTNNTALSSRIGLIAGNGNDQRHLPECITQGTCWNVTPNIILKNNLSAFSSEEGFVIFDAGEFGSIVIDHNNSYGNSPNYGEGMGSGTNDTQINPNMGSCYAWIPDGSPMKGAGAGGADIGANILYRYQDGGLTSTPLWNITTGAFPCGAVIGGVNDTSGSSCQDVHQRLHINNNGCAFPSGYATPPPPPAADPLVWLMFDEGTGTTAADSSGNAHPGTLQNGVTWVPGRVGPSAISCDGVNDAVAITGLLGGPSALTVSFWANVLTIPNSNGSDLVSMGDYAAVRLSATTVHPFYYKGGGAWNSTDYSSTAFVGTGWHHYAWVINPASAFQGLYIDTVLRNSSAFTDPIIWTGLGADTYLCRHGNSAMLFMNGMLDQLKISQHAWTQAEVTTEFNASGGIFHVARPPAGSDANSCQAAQNLATPKATITNTLPCMAGGSSILLHAGTYAEGLDSATQTIPGGSSFLAPTLIGRYQQDVVTLAPGVAGVPIINLQAAMNAYVVFDGLILDGLSTSTRAVAIGGSAHHIRVQNSEAHHATITPLYSQSNGNEFLTTFVHDGPSNGIFFDGTSQDGRAEGNTITAVAGWGIYDLSTGAAGHGTIIRGNLVRDLSGAGFAGIHVENGIAALIANNVIVNGIRCLQIATGASNVHVYNNTCATHTTTALQIDAGATGILVTNNIFALSQANTNAGTGTVFTTNLCTASGLGCAIVGDPLFQNAAGGNYRLNVNSPARNTGTTLAEVPTDFTGQSRPVGNAYDIGAYEATQTPLAPRPPTGFFLVQ